MHKDFFMRLVALCAFAGLSLWAANAVAAKLNTGGNPIRVRLPTSAPRVVFNGLYDAFV